MSFRWRTPDMIAALEAACPGQLVHNCGPGGDYDTDELLVEVHKGEDRFDGIFVTGFSPDTTVSDPSDHEITHVTLSDGQDSRGGLTSDDPKMADAYIAIRKALAGLLRGTGVNVFNHYRDFF